MVYRLTGAALAAMALLFAAGCIQEPDDPTGRLDEELEQALYDASGGVGPDFYRMPASDDLAAIPQDPLNPLTPEKVELGMLLFHETGIGLDQENAVGARSWSCASCHFAQAGFQAGRAQGIGEGGLGFGQAGEGRYKHPVYGVAALDVQPVRTPSAMNLAWQEAVLWNGQFGAQGINTGTSYSWTEGTPKEANRFGFQGLESQAIGGSIVHRQDFSEDILEELGYKELFDACFPEQEPSKRYSKFAFALAVAAYERTLMANESPFQRWLQGDRDAMGNYATEGAIIFFTKGECFTCHNGPSLANMEFHALGMGDLNGPNVFRTNPSDQENRGRESFTLLEEDLYRFKVPQLYNLADQPFYGHGSSFSDIREVIEYKNAAVRQNDNVPEHRLSEHFVPLGLSQDEIAKLTSFIDVGLYDPNLLRYVPDELPSGLCFPNNDPVSRVELGCD